MKKLTLLNFPAHFYTPQRKTDTMAGIFQLMEDKEKLIEKDEIATLQGWQRKYEEEVKAIPAEYVNFDFQAAKKYHVEEMGRIENRYMMPDLGKKDWDFGREVQRVEKERFESLMKIASGHYSKISSLASVKERIKKAEELLAEEVPLLPTPLTHKHINLMNREVAKKAQEGFELERYELLQTFHSGTKYWESQKFYSGVLFTWVRKTNYKGTQVKNKKDTSSQALK